MDTHQILYEYPYINKASAKRQCVIDNNNSPLVAKVTSTINSTISSIDTAVSAICDSSTSFGGENACSLPECNRPEIPCRSCYLCLKPNTSHEVCQSKSRVEFKKGFWALDSYFSFCYLCTLRLSNNDRLSEVTINKGM